MNPSRSTYVVSDFLDSSSQRAVIDLIKFISSIVLVVLFRALWQSSRAKTLLGIATWNSLHGKIYYKNDQFSVN